MDNRGGYGKGCAKTLNGGKIRGSALSAQLVASRVLPYQHPPDESIPAEAHPAIFKEGCEGL